MKSSLKLQYKALDARFKTLQDAKISSDQVNECHLARVNHHMLFKLYITAEVQQTHGRAGPQGCPAEGILSVQSK